MKAEKSAEGPASRYSSPPRGGITIEPSSICSALVRPAGGAHTGWEINGVDFAAPPWARLLDTRGQRFSCPACRDMARHTFHVPYPRKAEFELLTVLS